MEADDDDLTKTWDAKVHQKDAGTLYIGAKSNGSKHNAVLICQYKSWWTWCCWQAFASLPFKPASHSLAPNYEHKYSFFASIEKIVVPCIIIRWQKVLCNCQTGSLAMLEQMAPHKSNHFWRPAEQVVPSWLQLASRKAMRLGQLFAVSAVGLDSNWNGLL